MNKKFFWLTAVTVTALIAVLFAGCGDNGDPTNGPDDPPPEFNITVYAGLVNGTIGVQIQNTPVTKAQAGATIRLIVNPAEGYRVVSDSLKFNGTTARGTGGVNRTFIMPAEDVLITATFEEGGVEPIHPRDWVTQWDDELWEKINDMTLYEKVGQMHQPDKRGLA